MQSNPTALIVDDEVDLCRLMQITLTKMGIQSDVAYDIQTAKDCLGFWGVGCCGRAVRRTCSNVGGGF